MEKRSGEKTSKKKRVCIVCQRTFEVFPTPLSGGRRRSRRASSCVTCSHDCSRTYTRIYNRHQKKQARLKHQRLLKGKTKKKHGRK